MKFKDLKWSLWLVKVFKGSRSATNVKGLYKVSDSCQIPNLSFLLEQIFGDKSDGWLVEIGAFDGISFSNSSGLISYGWHADLVEPIPKYARLCKQMYKENKKVSIHEFAISDIPGNQDIYLAGALSSLDSEMISEYADIEWAKPSLENSTIQIRTLTMNEFLGKLNRSFALDLLIIDVEGHEEKVLNAFDFHFWSPTMIIIELSEHHPDLKKHRLSHYRCKMKIESFGYVIMYKDLINTVFVKKTVLDFTMNDRNKII